MIDSDQAFKLNQELAGKRVMITASASGIGLVIAKTFLENDALVAVCDISEERLAECQAVLPGVERILVDVSDPVQVDRFFAKALAFLGGLDVLVNNAGGLIKRQSVREYEWRLMEDIFALNTFSAMMVTSLCIPLLEKGTDPCIVNISSVAMRHGAPTATIYGASKSALDSFTRGIAKELAPTIRVNAVSPGVIISPFHDKYSTPEQLEAWREGNPLQKNGEPTHIAQTIKFIIENDFMHGETIDVNGGLYMR